MFIIGFASVHSSLMTIASAARAEIPLFGNSFSGTSRLNSSYGVTFSIGVVIYLELTLHRAVKRSVRSARQQIALCVIPMGFAHCEPGGNNNPIKSRRVFMSRGLSQRLEAADGDCQLGCRC